MVNLDRADRDRLGGASFVWIGKHGERLRPGRRVRLTLDRMGTYEREHDRRRRSDAVERPPIVLQATLLGRREVRQPRPNPPAATITSVTM
jgi:hypothetical protein